MIPARYNSTRFPGKLMKDLGGKSIIRRTYDATLATGLFEAIFVVTDSKKIFEEIENHAGKAIYSETKHDCGSDRIAEAVQDMDADIVVNVQGDEPFASKKILENLLNVFKEDDNQKIDLASLMTPLISEDNIINPNHVKVITDTQGFALYFSRSVIPYPREKSENTTHYKHIGIYAFRKQALLDFAKLPMQPLEAAEKIECLRYLEYGKTIKMIKTTEQNIGIDTPEDLEKAREFLKRNPSSDRSDF